MGFSGSSGGNRGTELLLAALVGFATPCRLQALDLDPKPLGYAAASDPRDVVFFGDYACVADGVAGLELFDLSHPVGPQRVGGYFIGAPAESVVISESHAFVAAGNDLLVIDLSSPVKPRRVGRYAGEGSVVDVVVSGQHAYLAEHPRWDGTNEVGGGLQVIDVSDPTDPRRVGGFRTRGYANSIALLGGYAYLADGRNTQSHIQGEGLVVIDVSDPANPKRIGSYATGGYAEGVAVSGRSAYLSEQSRHDGTNWVGGGLEVIDIGDPANPQPVGAYDVRGSYSSGGLAGDIVVAGDYVFVAGVVVTEWEDWPGPLHVIDIRDPARPRLVGTYPGYVRGVAVKDNVAWVAEVFWRVILHGHRSRGARLQRVDIDHPANPQHIARYDTVGGAPVVSGRFAYVALGERWENDQLIDGGIEVIDVSDPANPRLAGRLDIDGYVAVSGNFAYVANSKAGLQVIDITNPANPQRVGSYATVGDAQGVAVSGRYAYLAERPRWDGQTGKQVGGGLEVIDISDPTYPRRAGRQQSGLNHTHIQGVAVSGTLACLLDGEAGLLVIDISDPANPRRISEYNGDGAALGMAVSGNYAYLTVAGGSLSYYNFQYGGDYDVIGDAGLVVIDLSNPASPQRVGSCSTPGYPQGVAVSGNIAYVADGAGLHIIDISDPANPRRVGGNSSFSGANAVAVANGKVFVAARDQGLIILHQHQPLRFEPVAREVNGALRLRMAGPPGVPGRIQRSDDLAVWTDWLPIKFGEDPLQISGPDAASAVAGFYRIAVP